MDMSDNIKDMLDMIYTGCQSLCGKPFIGV